MLQSQYFEDLFSMANYQYILCGRLLTATRLYAQKTLFAISGTIFTLKLNRVWCLGHKQFTVTNITRLQYQKKLKNPPGGSGKSSGKWCDKA